jgi:arylsulfatase A-like enzyme
MKRNVLLLMVDAMRADRLFGPERDCVTPVLDSLAANSTRFPHAFSTASVTTCCTASILTATYPFSHGIRSLGDHRLRNDLPTLPEAFRAGGYFTWAEVTGPLLPQVGLNRGFDHYGHRDYGATLDTEWMATFTERLRTFPEPWFGLLHLWELHHPRRVTPQFNNPAYGRNVYDRAVSSLDYQLGKLLAALPEDTVLVFTADHGEFLSSSGTTSFMVRMKKTFKWVKQRVPAAKKLKRLTPMLFSSASRLGKQDGKGQSDLYYHWLGHGFHVYDYLVHVPFFIHAPGLFPENHTVDQLVSHVDIFPTLASAFQLPIPETGTAGSGHFFNGSDLMPLITEAGRDDLEDAWEDDWGDRAIYMEASGGRITPLPEQWMGAIRTAHYKYVRGLYSDAIPEELYDLEQDPGEKHNLAAEAPAIMASLRARLAALMDEGTIPLPEVDTSYQSEEEADLKHHLRSLGYLD